MRKDHRRKCLGIVNDTRVIEANAPEDVLHVSGFCEPLVTRDRWNNVQLVRQVRRERWLASQKSKHSNKLFEPLAPGMTLNNLLSDLVFCECKRRMTASSSRTYVPTHSFQLTTLDTFNDSTDTEHRRHVLENLRCEP